MPTVARHNVKQVTTLQQMTFFTTLCHKLTPNKKLSYRYDRRANILQTLLSFKVPDKVEPKDNSNWFMTSKFPCYYPLKK